MAALISLVLVLAALWVATFFFSTGSWGEYRPPETELQNPLPSPTILIPTLTPAEAREILERATASGVDSDDAR